MNFFKRHRKLHIWLLTDLALLTLYLLLRGNRTVMNILTQRVTQPLKRALGAACSLVELSVAEVIYVTAIAGGVLLLACAVRRLVEGPARLRALYRMVMGTACTALTVYLALTLLWGVNYYADSFQDKSGIYGREASVEELEELTVLFAQGVTRAADGVARDENGLFAESREDIFAASAGIYAGLYEEFPFLEQKDYLPKALTFSEAFSAMDFTGFFFPFTGETNLNVHCPAAFLPSTIVHELAHRRGIASEQECNFLAVVGSIASDDPVYQYSGWLMGYVHVGNALYRAAPERWKEIRLGLPEEVQQDLRYNNAYWAAWEGPINDAASKAYDSFLKNYGDEDGVQSYGMVVDMLIAYYLD